MPHAEIHPAQPRQTALVAFRDGRLFEGPVGLPLKAFVEAAYPASPEPIAAGVMNGELVELTHPVLGDASVQVLDTTTTDGMRIYQRSLLFVLVVAANELFPEARIIVQRGMLWASR